MVEKSRTAYTLAKMGYLPNFMLKLSREDMRMTMGREVTSGVMFSVSIPLWLWKNQSLVSEKQAQIRDAEASYQATKNKVLFEQQL